MVALMIAFGTVALLLVVYSEALDFVGKRAAGSYWPLLRKFQLPRPLRAAAVCAAVGVFMFAFFGDPLRDALAQSRGLFTGDRLTIHLSPGNGPAQLTSRFTFGGKSDVGPPAVTPPSPHTSSRGKTAVGQIKEGLAASCDGPSSQDQAAFEQMIHLYNAHKYGDLLSACREASQSDPSWATPYLFCGVAEWGQKDMGGAEQMFNRFQTVAKGSAGATQGACRDASDFLVTHLPR